MSAHNPKHTSDRMCGDLVAARSKQWRRYFTDVHITGNLNLRPPVTRERSQVQSLIAPTFPRDFAASAGLSSWTSDRPVIKAFEYDKSPHSRGGSMRDIKRSSRANQSIPGGSQRYGRCLTSSARVQEITGYPGGIVGIVHPALL
jgi:hypothetical protein